MQNFKDNFLNFFKREKEKPDKPGETITVKNEIEIIKRLCEKFDAKQGDCYSSFDKPISEDELLNWEKEHNAFIPELYKEWLRFTKKCVIAQNIAILWGPSEFNSDYVDKEMIVIGELFGDGERVCFSKTTGDFFEVFDGRIKRINGFEEVLRMIIRLLDDRPMLELSKCSSIIEKIKSKGSGADTEIQSFIRVLTEVNSTAFITEKFNEFSETDRLNILQLLPERDRNDLLIILRYWAVVNFWKHERELLKNGECTRRWDPDQIEMVMNISEISGNFKSLAGIAKDSNGRIYYGRHMYSPLGTPQYAGEWKNIQALAYIEYYEGVLKMKK